MLVLSRREGERICIGDDIVITVVRVGSGGVRLGIEAPSEVRVDREEVYQRRVGLPADSWSVRDLVAVHPH